MQREYLLQELESVVKEFLESLGEAKVIGFSGNLGAGKTTFTKELLKQLGFDGNVISPTFVLRRDYKIPLSSGEGLGERVLIHIDAYRLEKPEHIFQVISKEELADKNNLIIVEWPEKVMYTPGGLQFDEIYLFEHIDENTRRISVQKNNN